MSDYRLKLTDQQTTQLQAHLLPVVPLIKTGTVLPFTHSTEFHLPKAELVTTISRWNSAFCFLSPTPLLFGVNSSLKSLPPYRPLGLLISSISFTVRKRPMWREPWNPTPERSSVESSVFWNALTFCPAKHHFLFFWNNIMRGIPTCT